VYDRYWVVSGTASYSRTRRLAAGDTTASANKAAVPRLVLLTRNLPYIQVSLSAHNRQLLGLGKLVLDGKNVVVFRLSDFRHAWAKTYIARYYLGS